MSCQAGLALPGTLPELESHLGEAANILRGSPADRTDWKSYILPLLFFKRICDVWDEEHAAMRAEYGEDFADEHRFQVPEGCHWPAVRRAPKNVGTALANAMRGVEAANQKPLCRCHVALRNALVPHLDASLSATPLNLAPPSGSARTESGDTPPRTIPGYVYRSCR